LSQEQAEAHRGTGTGGLATREDFLEAQAGIPNVLHERPLSIAIVRELVGGMSQVREKKNKWK
jgi:hypothetical protein